MKTTSTTLGCMAIISFLMLAIGGCRKESNSPKKECEQKQTGKIFFVAPRFGKYMVSVADSNSTYVDTKTIDSGLTYLYDNVYEYEANTGCYTISVIAFYTSLNEPDTTYYLHNSCVDVCDTFDVIL